MKSALFRRMHLSSKSFQMICLCAGLTLVVFAILNYTASKDLLGALSVGSLKAFTVFLTWAFARELDPDSKVEAFYGLPPLIMVFFFYDDFLVLPVFFILLCMRVVTRSAGYIPSFLDFLFLFVYALGLYFFQSFFFLLFGGVFLFMEGKASDGRKVALVFAGFMLLIAGLSFLNLYSVVKTEISMVQIGVAGVITALFAYRLSSFKMVFSMDDTSSYYLSPRRIKDAGTITLLMVIMVAVNSGYVFQLGAIWFAMLGVSLPYIKNIAKGYQGREE